MADVSAAIRRSGQNSAVVDRENKRLADCDKTSATPKTSQDSGLLGSQLMLRSGDADWLLPGEADVERLLGIAKLRCLGDDQQRAAPRARNRRFLRER